MKRLCVFCGSREGDDPVYRKAAAELGRLLAEEGLGVVYGGGRVGLMGVLADAALEAGAQVIGSIPSHLVERELAHPGVDLRVVEDMHQRKALMARLSDGFIALPGGLGTFEELFEVLTWGQLGLHGKPCGLLNVGGYFDPLARMLDHAVQEGFVRSENRAMVLVEEKPALLLARLRSYRPPSVDKAAWALEGLQGEEADA